MPETSTTPTEHGRHWPKLPPKLPGETRDAYTDRLTGADGTGRVPNAHISQLETGTIRKPSITTLIPLAKAYEIPLAKAYEIPLRQLCEAAGHGTDWGWEDSGEPVTEYAIQMSGGGMHVRNDDPKIEKIYPLAQWLPDQRRDGGHVYRRRIIVVEGWEEVEGG